MIYSHIVEQIDSFFLITYILTPFDLCNATTSLSNFLRQLLNILPGSRQKFVKGGTSRRLFIQK